jgi:hypothetical protein
VSRAESGYRPLQLGLAVVFCAGLFVPGLAMLDGSKWLSDPAAQVLAAAGVEDRLLPVAGMAIAVAAIAGGQFVFMVLVADELCPDAPMLVSGFLRFIVAVTVWGGLVVAALCGFGAVWWVEQFPW